MPFVQICRFEFNASHGGRRQGLLLRVCQGEGSGGELPRLPHGDVDPEGVPGEDARRQRERGGGAVLRQLQTAPRLPVGGARLSNPRPRGRPVPLGPAAPRRLLLHFQQRRPGNGDVRHSERAGHPRGDAAQRGALVRGLREDGPAGRVLERVRPRRRYRSRAECGRCSSHVDRGRNPGHSRHSTERERFQTHLQQTATICLSRVPSRSVASERRRGVRVLQAVPPAAGRRGQGGRQDPDASGGRRHHHHHRHVPHRHPHRLPFRPRFPAKRRPQPRRRAKVPDRQHAQPHRRQPPVVRVGSRTEPVCGRTSSGGQLRALWYRWGVGRDQLPAQTQEPVAVGVSHR